ncbi:low molecular weight phosphatase family protein [Flexivirga sp. ID2601S]|uniref:Low molecular weight phosphatase family protein n=1 Tax=Flexivirga aerilata TaxID=1656889 RepID=A0A849AKM8_9MICO|nr:low molecular weight phosphatase family protein [Flexivirga aerilata]NNG40086.1 low molecular weight phosphatase family protein [Flexivirga aerilata]
MTMAVAQVLVVCTGNVCRSPAAAALLAAHLGRQGCDGGTSVRSAGTAALTGAPMTEDMSRLVAAAGASTQHAGRQLDRDLVASADLVLTATTAHRSEVVRLVPGAVRRTFTLREFARLTMDFVDVAAPSTGMAAGRVSTLAAYAQGRRRPVPGADDIADPFGGTSDDYEAAFAAISDAVGVIAARLLGASG